MDIEALFTELNDKGYYVCEDSGVYIGPKWCIVDSQSQDYDILLDGTSHYHNREDAVEVAARKLGLVR
jgi:hypothetical protein